ncbi:hypothetical protein DBB29_01615 [Pandoraea cepalis]|uniref:Uncharacterized protein n=1 Tax=Pandoraea cepalis TaxID=2508294 RepID=A0AAW7MGM1_9BURK|nr:hypothetical protein [Pandoraea cepalis]MDN4576822.1 hypothetical protein [Pandoraea cepalis]
MALPILPTLPLTRFNRATLISATVLTALFDICIATRLVHDDDFALVQQFLDVDQTQIGLKTPANPN